MKLKFTRKTWYFLLLASAAASMLNGFAVLSGTSFGLIEQIAFGNGKHPLFILQIGIESGKFAKQNIIFFTNTIGIRWNHKQQYGIAFHMPEETQSKPLSFARSLYNSGYIGHDKRPIISIGYDTQIRFESSKRIIGYFRTSR